MQTHSVGFASATTAARDEGISPVYFAWFTAKDRDTGAPVTIGLWSGDEDISVSVTPPGGGAAQVRTYIGGCNLSIPSGIAYVADLTDNPVQISVSQIADAAQELVRGLDLRLGGCEIHVTTMSGGAFAPAPELQWVGVVDEGPISTPAAGGEGGISLTVRSEIMWQLTATNPAKSSDAHQRRRLATDRFCEYSATVQTWPVQWFKN